MAQPHLHVVMPARSERGRGLEAEMKLHSIHKGGREHGSMANSRRGMEGIHGTLLRLGEDGSTVSWGGSSEAIQPTGTLRDGREALLEIGEGRRGERGEKKITSVTVVCMTIQRPSMRKNTHDLCLRELRVAFTMHLC